MIEESANEATSPDQDTVERNSHGSIMLNPARVLTSNRYRFKSNAHR